MAFSGAVLLAAGIPESYQRQNFFHSHFRKLQQSHWTSTFDYTAKIIRCGKLWVLFRIDALEDDQYTLADTRRAGFLP